VLRTDGGERADACADSNRAASFPRLGSARQLAGAARAAGGKAAAGGRGVALVWFRADLRTHDHEALAAAASESTSLVPVFIVGDTRAPRRCHIFTTPPNLVLSRW
jgi:hypothetical protein